MLNQSVLDGLCRKLIIGNKKTNYYYDMRKLEISYQVLTVCLDFYPNYSCY